MYLHILESWWNFVNDLGCFGPERVKINSVRLRSWRNGLSGWVAQNHISKYLIVMAQWLGRSAGAGVSSFSAGRSIFAGIAQIPAKNPGQFHGRKGPATAFVEGAEANDQWCLRPRA